MATKPKQDGDKATRTPLPEIDFGAVKARKASREELVAFRNTKVRDPQQVPVDKLVGASYKDWQAAGGEHDWLKCADAATVVTVRTEHVEAFKTRVRRAGTYHGVTIRFGKTVALEDGTSEVLFIAKDKRPGDAEEGAEDGANEAAPAVTEG